MFQMPKKMVYALPEIIGNTDLFVGRKKEFDFFLGQWFQDLEKKFGSKRLSEEGSFKAAAEEYTEAKLFFKILSGEKLDRIKEVDLPLDSYIGGMCDLVGELVRLATNSAAVGKPEEVKKIVLYHHERWDGNGFPEGISKDKIPITAQIVGILDKYFSLIEDKPNRDKYSKSKAIEIIDNLKGQNFKPELVDIFKEVMEND